MIGGMDGAACGRPFFVMRYQWMCLLAMTMSAGATELELSLSSRTVSEPMAIKGFAEQWNGRLHKGDAAWTRNRLDIGVRHGSWRIGYVQRYDYILRFNDDTADLY